VHGTKGGEVRNQLRPTPAWHGQSLTPAHRPPQASKKASKLRGVVHGSEAGEVRCPTLPHVAQA